MTSVELLTVAEMTEADRLAVLAGVPSLTLMENAGRAVADEAQKMVPAGSRIVVLCGPGNNGGDGFVAARLLAERGYDVRIAPLVAPSELKGDAAIMAGRCAGIPKEDIYGRDVSGDDLYIDALFGAGLNRPLDDCIGSDIFTRIGDDDPVLAVDVPSGLNGTTGQVMGSVLPATRTVTFFRLKPGHLLMPGRALCGTIVRADIGIPQSVLSRIGSSTRINDRSEWLPWLPRPRIDGHKYSRGHVVVVSGAVHATGAARLGARAALRVGAGLVTVASPPDALAVNAAQLTSIMLAPFEGAAGLAALLVDPRKNAVLIGPGCGVGAQTRSLVETVLGSSAACVLDADALTSFADDPEKLLALTRAGAKPTAVLTPHEGEFKRLFPSVAGSKLDRAREAARMSGAVVILKGPDTVIAAPNGQARINDNAPPWLATAGSGDVLAGFVAGLLAQRQARLYEPIFDLACVGVGLHGECARRFGRGLIAEDLPEVLPAVLRELDGGI